MKTSACGSSASPKSCCASLCPTWPATPWISWLMGEASSVVRVKQHIYRVLQTCAHFLNYFGFWHIIAANFNFYWDPLWYTNTKFSILCSGRKLIPGFIVSPESALCRATFYINFCTFLIATTINWKGSCHELGFMSSNSMMLLGFPVGITCLGECCSL